MHGDLRVQAQEDLQTTIQEEFGQTIMISKPDGTEFKDFVGNSNDISIALDPDTGLMITGRTAQAVFVLKEVLDHFGELPKKLWKVQFLELSPNSFCVKDVRPDSSQGALILVIGE